jgi:hypothetical protein
MPKDMFSKMPSHFFSEFSLDLSGADRLERVYQSARSYVRIRFHQEMDMIGFAIKLQKLAIGICADPIEVLPKPCQYLVVQCFPPVLCNKTIW